MHGLPIFFVRSLKVIEELLAENGFVADIDDDAFGEAYERCPAVQKSVIKNAVSFAYALAQNGTEPVSQTRRFGHVEHTLRCEPLQWAFFAVDVRRFPLPAFFSAMVQALVAKVQGLVVHVSGPVTDPLLFGCDFLSAHQVFTSDHRPILKLLADAGPGACIDLAGLGLDYPRTLRPDPAGYGTQLCLPDSGYVQAYRAVVAPTATTGRPYISYGGEPESAPVVMAERLLGCWVWDVISPDTFRQYTSTYS
jgi:hypothetical protein